jgi:hypothetical protein
MVYGRRPSGRLPTLGGLGGGPPPPPDVIALLVVVFVTFTLQFFAAGLVDLLRLTPLAWRLGFVWQPVTYPVTGYGPASVWFLLELLILFWFGRDVFWRLGRRGFWRLLALGAVGGAIVALLTDVLLRLGGVAPAAPFALMQGQRMLLVLLIAAFATLYGRATIYLFFVLPVQARWFLPLEILIAFMGFLATRDLAGFLGICAGVGLVWWRLRRPGGRLLDLRDLRLRLQRWWIQQRLRRLRRRRGFTVVPGDRQGGGGPFTH